MYSESKLEKAPGEVRARSTPPLMNSSFIHILTLILSFPTLSDTCNHPAPIFSFGHLLCGRHGLKNFSGAEEKAANGRATSTTSSPFSFPAHHQYPLIYSRPHNLQFTQEKVNHYDVTLSSNHIPRRLLPPYPIKPKWRAVSPPAMSY